MGVRGTSMRDVKMGGCELHGESDRSAWCDGRKRSKGRVHTHGTPSLVMSLMFCYHTACGGLSLTPRWTNPNKAGKLAVA